MNTNVLAGKWKQFAGKIKAEFGKLTDDDLARAEGNADIMTGLLQERYGYTQDRARQEWANFVAALDAHGEGLKAQAADLTEEARRKLEQNTK